MVAENDQPSIPVRKLAERLRDLREREHLTRKHSRPLFVGGVGLRRVTGSEVTVALRVGCRGRDRGWFRG
jgi:hypothetical protein